MSPSPEEHLQEAIRLHQASNFKKGFKEAEKARKKFQKEGRTDRAIEALRVMGDCTLNARDLKKAQKIYEDLLNEGRSISNLWFQAAANWGLGQVSLHKMDYSTALHYFQVGLEQAQSIADNWYIAWNAFGLGNALRGLARLEDGKRFYQEALQAFRTLNQLNIITWVERALKEIGAEVAEEGSTAEVRLWLCPMCGSKFNQNQATALRNGKLATCEYCGTTVG